MDWFGSMFQCFGFQMTFPDDYSGWLFWMPPDDCLGLLFQMTIRDASFRWLFRTTVRNSATISKFNYWFMFLRPIRISTADSYFNQSFDWFVWRPPTSELWPWSPPDTNFCLLVKSLLMKCFMSNSYKKLIFSQER